MYKSERDNEKILFALNNDILETKNRIEMKQRTFF